MVEESGAVAAYIDRKSIPAKEYTKLESLLSGEGIPIVPENDLLRMGELSWDSYQRVLQLAEETAPGGTVTFHGTWPDGDPEPIDIPSDLLEEALRCDAQGFVGGLENIPVVRIATEKKPVLPRFITIGACKNHVLHHLISLCVNIIRRGENTSIRG